MILRSLWSEVSNNSEGIACLQGPFNCEVRLPASVQKDKSLRIFAETLPYQLGSGEQLVLPSYMNNIIIVTVSVIIVIGTVVKNN